jgi:pimeloyl-ACP methyl ester carboxylesterase
MTFPASPLPSLAINGTVEKVIDSLPPVDGWESSLIQVTSSRSEGTQLDVEVPAGGWVEFELVDGERILVASEDVPRYLGSTSRAADDGKLRIGESLQPPGLDDTTSRGLGAWIIKAIRIAKPKAAAPAARALAAALESKALGMAPGFYRVEDTPANLKPLATAPGHPEPLLVLIHGTMSSANGSFGKLWDGPNRSALSDRFGDRVYALQHNTLTESPVANALALARALPAQARLHLLTHSRGGLVGELLARGGRKDRPPFTEQEIGWVLDSAQERKRDGYEQVGRLLRELTAELERKQFRVERFVRVACPARGTTLLAGRLDRWASAIVNLTKTALKLGGGVGAAAAGVVGTVYEFAAALVAERASAETLPGLEAMMPDSPLIALLNLDDAEIRGTLHVVAGDYGGSGVLKYLANAFSEKYYGGLTDLVVNTASMHGGARRTDGIFRRFVDGPEEYHHLNYFEKATPARAIARALTDLKPDAVAEFEALATPSREHIARGGQVKSVKADAPILFILPGMMGSALRRSSEVIWFDVGRIALGGMGRLTIEAADVTPAGWVDFGYEALAAEMAKHFEIRPFPYDWRRSIHDEAARFGEALDSALDDGERQRRPVRILAHSMGGLVARVALSSRWERLKKLDGARFVQLGTPNGGSASIAAVLLARDRLVNLLSAIDFKHDTESFLDVINKFPGVLELMAWLNVPGVTTDFFDLAQWKTWQDTDAAANKSAQKSDGQGGYDAGQRTHEWSLPLQASLEASKASAHAIAKTPIDADVTVYVAGKAKETPVDVIVRDGRLVIRTTREGDGRVPWATGIPKGVPCYYAKVEHGNLSSDEACFAAYREILDTGATRLLDTSPPAGRDVSDAISDKSEPPLALFPSSKEVLSAALGASPDVPRIRDASHAPPVEIVIVQGSMATADSPVILGAYAFDGIRGTAGFMNERLGNRLQQSCDRGTYPNAVGEAQVFLQRSPDARPRGAIVVGLGELGSTTPGHLARAYARGLLAYAHALENQPDCAQPGKDSEGLEVSTLLIGTGFGGLSVETSLRSLLDAIVLVAGQFANGNVPPLRKITVYERTDNRAVTAALALDDLLRDSRYSGQVYGTCSVRPGKGGFRPLVLDDLGSNGMRRVHITLDEKSNSVQFTLITDRARNVVAVEASLRKDIDSLLRRASGDTRDKPGLARAMFEMLVPNDFKEGLASTGGVVLGLDAQTAEYPWELLRDDREEAPPLCTRISLIRQLATERGRPLNSVAGGATALVIGDTDSGYARLIGAEREAASIAGKLRGLGWDAMLLVRPGPDEVFEKLFDAEYRVLHLACHGIAEEYPNEKGCPPRVGAVLSQSITLTSAHINKLRRVPEFVFLNCCHLGDAKLEHANRWNRLAANLAIQFIEMGAKAVIAAGWEVDDAAAGLFSETLYDALLQGKPFGRALLSARRKTWEAYRSTNTWGAYQAYGDENYRLIRPSIDSDADSAPRRMHAAELLARLDEARANAEVEQDKTRQAATRKRLQLLAQQIPLALRRDARVRSALGYAFAAVRAWEDAIVHFREALAAEEATLDVRAIERLADAETRHGETVLKSAVREAPPDDSEIRKGWALLDSASERLVRLLALGESTERLSLYAANRKRRAEVYLLTGDERFLVELTSAADSYELATRHGATAERLPYYPATNALFLRATLRARGALAPADVANIEAALDATVTRICRDAELRLAVSDDFFHFVALPDAMLAAWLWRGPFAQGSAGTNTKTARRKVRSDTVTEALDRLSSQYAVAVQRFGSAREIDSTYRQIDSLISMLPPDHPGKEDLRELKRLIEEKVSRKQ